MFGATLCVSNPPASYSGKTECPRSLRLRLVNARHGIRTQVSVHKLLRGRVKTQGDARCGEASLLHKLASWQSWLLEREPHGEELSRVKQTRRNGVCTSVRRCVGECEWQAGDYQATHPTAIVKMTPWGLDLFSPQHPICSVYKAKMIFLSAKAEHCQPLI